MSKGFPIEWLEELKRKNDIVSTISRYVPVKSKGSNQWACCPFHHEKTPSFCVNEMEQFYHCFGCGETGDVIKFVQKIESCDFWQACEILAKNANMEMPTLKNNDDIQNRKKTRDTILKILDATYKHYEQNLYLKTSTKPQEYIKKRKLTKKELDKFHIGYSVSWTEIIDYLKTQGFTLEEMQLANVVDVKNGRAYDFMGERLVFPIFNIYDECIGFSSRSLDPDARAKYKNSINTPVFDKSKNMFGVNIVRKLKQSQALDYIIIVEGQMDVISMNKAGFANTVACLGTALTTEHAKTLKRLCENIVVCLDGDSAGQKATVKTVDILAEAGLNVKAVKLPDGADPDEYINSFGAEQMKKQLDNAMDYVEFKIRHRLEDFNLEKHDEKARFVNIAISIINELKTNSEKEIYLDLIKKISGVPIDILKRDLGDVNIIENIQPETPQLTVSEDAEIKAIKFIIASLLYKKEYANFDFDLDKYLINPSYKQLYSLLKNANNDNKDIKISNLYDVFEVESEPNILDIINFNFEPVADSAKYFDECVWKIRETYLKNNIQRLTDEFKKCSSAEQRKIIASQLNNEQKKLRTKSLED